MSAKWIVGLTGGIGSGKSAVCQEFERLGVPIVDADIVAREVVAPGSQGLEAVVAKFGERVVDQDGSLNRALLRQIVFEDASKRIELEELLHPKIRDLTDQKLAAIDEPYCILCVPLLIEKGGYRNVDRILVIDCATEVQIERVKARDNLTAERVEAIMATQATREERLRHAHDVIENSGSLQALREPIEKLHEKYTRLASASNTHI